MILSRSLRTAVVEDLAEYPAVGLLGPRQVGKTTFAKALAEELRGQETEYIDLQRPSSRLRLSDAEGYLAERSDRLLILDEIQLLPELFGTLRSVIDEDRRPGRFILLGSASPQLMRSSGESLAGRISYNELTPFGLLELASVPELDWRRHWVTGGYPVPLLQLERGARRVRYFENLTASFVSRDLAELGQPADATELARLPQMLASVNGGLVNRQTLSRSLTVSNKTVARYLDLLERAFLIRQLRPWLPNLTKRLVKSPKVYVRDTGWLHALLGIRDYDQLRGHLIVGASWEGYVIEETARALRRRGTLHFYRTANGAELDLVIGLGDRVVAVGIKLGNAPQLTRGFYQAIEDVGPAETYVVVPEGERFRLRDAVWVIGLREYLTLVEEWGT